MVDNDDLMLDALTVWVNAVRNSVISFSDVNKLSEADKVTVDKIASYLGACYAALNGIKRKNDRSVETSQS